MTTLDCRRCGQRTSSGNCPALLEDGHVVQCVGEWVDNEKHVYLQRYIDATREVRRRYTETGFLDLFAGPGRVRLRENGDVCDGSPLIALSHDTVPFTRVVLCDLALENVEALRSRTATFGDRVHIAHGDANARIGALVAMMPASGLNLALVDPFALSPLNFETIRQLAGIQRMDIIINFPTSDIRRNRQIYHGADSDVIARLLGIPAWRTMVGPGDLALEVYELFIEALSKIGYTGARNRTIPICNSVGAEMYRLVFASKHRLGDSIWQSVTKHTASGQRGFGW